MTPGDIEDLLLAYEADVAVWTRTPDKYNYAEVVANRKKIADLLEARTPQEATGVITAEDLQDAWHKYRDLFGEDPHGTLPQLRALLVGLPKLPHEPNPSEARGVRCPHDGETCGDDKCEDCPNRSAPVEPKPSEARGGYSSGWVIEGAWSAVDRPEYWVGSSSWSTDPYKALRFATRESAQQAADLMCAGVNVRIACHEFAEE